MTDALLEIDYRALVVELVKDQGQDGPIVHDPDDGPYCFFCGVAWEHKSEHKRDCLWLRARTALESEAAQRARVAEKLEAQR